MIKFNYMIFQPKHFGENSIEWIQGTARVSSLPENNSSEGNGGCCRTSLCKERIFEIIFSSFFS